MYQKIYTSSDIDIALRGKTEYKKSKVAGIALLMKSGVLTN